MIDILYRTILRRAPFKGQYRLFLWLFYRQLLPRKKTIARPLSGNFKLNVDTGNYIDAWVYYTGEYEAFLKKWFKNNIRTGNTVLDVGANIGFHTLYFSDLVGPSGRVIAFEPVPVNFSALTANINLNTAANIEPLNIALGLVNAETDIHIDREATNPGAYNLFEEGEKNTRITIAVADDFIPSLNIREINLVKIDVEGFEYQVIKGMQHTLAKYKPTVVFEYERDYICRNGDDPSLIFELFSKLGYSLFSIDVRGQLTPFVFNPELAGAQLIAIKNENNA